MSAAKQMDMDMIHTLARVAAGVDHRPIAVDEALGARDLGRGPQQVAQQCGMLFAGFGERSDVLARHD